MVSLVGERSRSDIPRLVLQHRSGAQLTLKKVSGTSYEVSVRNFEGKVSETPLCPKRILQFKWTGPKLLSSLFPTDDTFVEVACYLKYVAESLVNELKRWTHIWVRVPALPHQTVPGKTKSGSLFTTHSFVRNVIVVKQEPNISFSPKQKENWFGGLTVPTERSRVCPCGCHWWRTASRRSCRCRGRACNPGSSAPRSTLRTTTASHKYHNGFCPDQYQTHVLQPSQTVFHPVFQNFKDVLLVCWIYRADSCNENTTLEVQTHHVALGAVDSLLQTLVGHPLDGKGPHLVAFLVVVGLINVSRQTEVSNFHQHLLIHPGIPHRCDDRGNTIRLSVIFCHNWESWARTCNF